MFTKSKPNRLVMVVGALLLLSGCTRSTSNVDSQGKTDNPVFPDAASAVRTEGSFVNVANLEQVRAGMTKAQIYELLGVPHFSEGVMKVKEWNYIFHFTKEDKSVLTCQYKVLFDTDMKAQSFYFLPENCLSQLKAAPVAPVHKELSASSLFAFGSASLSAEGVKHVKLLASELKSESLTGKHIVVTGYTDRIGNPAQNQRLSQARADSVKQLLVTNGIPAQSIETRGMGDSNPQVFCPGKQSAAVIDCLAPNRRMTVDINAG
ncbi:outer membrane protein assembly factor BamE [Buttiauxella sp. B2]|uniref:OmpA family protein n=1 Tax=Buttiauxella sp. B2 TaxID=2587812 RepID=UPI00112082B0|nr:OmpA family protein [Buttiauxella sp. B2]TNV20477.1 outer membrane protein assembly factor BamE [Buttiauxella sp. B2]